jgi:hypothetical protein
MSFVHRRPYRGRFRTLRDVSDVFHAVDQREPTGGDAEQVGDSLRCA